MLGAASSEVITWMKDKGRSFGVRPMLATQRPDQLDAGLRTNFLTFNSLVSFSQQHADSAAEIAKSTKGGGVVMTEDDIIDLLPYHAVVRTSIKLQRQSACVLSVYDFEADRRNSLEMQGFGPNAKDSSGGISKAELEMELWK
jgi:hypothetical protein